MHLVVVREWTFDRADGGATRVVLFGGQEEEQFVLDDRAADVGVVNRFLGMIALVVCTQIPGAQARIGLQWIGKVVVAFIGSPRSAGWLPLGTHAKVPLVGTTLADLVDHATDGTAIRGAVAADEGLLLLDGTIGKLDTALRRERIGDIHAVDVIRILGSRGASKHVDRRTQRTRAQLR